MNNIPGKRLYCVRHAKSLWANSSGDSPALEDRQRPLNKRGLRDAPEMGRRLARRGIRPDLILSSPAERARLTARALARELGYSTEQIVEREELYFQGPDALLQVIGDIDDDFDAVLFVSHNPDISRFVSLLSREDCAELPTCAVVEITLRVASWAAIDYGFGELVELDFPKKR